MKNHPPALGRRELLQLGLGLGTGLMLPGLMLPGQLLAQNTPAGLLTKAIPSSGEHVPLIGIGTARRYDVAATEEELAPLREVIRNLPGTGGTMIDTAPSYGNAETVVGNLVAEAGNRDQLFLCTKVGSGRQSVAAGLAEIERSFQRLRTDRIDLLQVHNLGGVEQMLPILREMKQAGRIRYYGMTTSSDRQYDDFERILASTEMDFIQIDYAIDNRGAEERILPLALDRGVAVQTNLPFGRGRVFDAFGDQPIPDWAAEFGISSWAQFALKYIVSHPAVTCAIPGTARPAYLVDNIGASMGRLPDAATRQRMADLIDSA
ncbi:MAG: aldo/keto reductase [Pseudomonadales bacterium]|nr:aldo/keto reductase [Pseudomonadales bacterium]